MTAVRPGADVPIEARAFQGHRAGVVTRCLAGALDYLVVLVILCLLWLGWAALGYLLARNGFSLPAPSLAIGLIVGFWVEVVYLTASWATTGRTYGNQVMGLRVVNLHGRRMRWAGALTRALLVAVFPLGLLWAAVSRRNRSVQDVILHTSVIYDWTSQPEPQRE